MKNFVKTNKGITLIALVITIVVLLILAGVSIQMLGGENGIITQTKNAKEKTGMAEIKERAELAKLSANIQSWIGKNNGVIKRNAVVSAINKEFSGSKISGSVVTTSDNQYDIIVDSNLNITVEKHQATNTGISFTYIANETESRAVALDVYPVIENVPNYEEYASKYIENIEDGPELIQIFVDGFNYAEKDYTGGVTLTWQEITGGDYSTVDAFYQAVFASSGQYTDYRDMMISCRLVNPREYIETYGKEVIITCNGETQTINSAKQSYAKFLITENGEYTISVVDSDNNKTEQDIDITECKEEKKEKYSEIYTENTTTTIEGYKVTIPAGFAIGTSENVGHVSTGLVITDNVDSNGNSTGNEFVWIPVKEDLTVGNTGRLMATGSTTNYIGVLYNWSVDQTGNITYTSTSTREPDVVSEYDGGEDDTVGITKANLQTEYNSMIESVKKYGGFYVARYEMSIENGKAVSKLGVTPTSAGDEETSSWYGLYSKAKTYTNSYNSVQSSMMWGSQYDAMLNFALTGNDSSKVHSTSYGNYSGYLLKTGLTQTSDVINNIYDLAGNMREWTLVAYGAASRVAMGGYCNSAISPSFRGAWNPNAHSGDTSSRLTLYVKW